VSDITIVTAFFDIGRGNWTKSMEKHGGPLPHYLERSNDVYIERFSHLCKLDNELIVYTSEEIAPRLEKIGDDLGKTNLKIVSIDFATAFAEPRAEVRAIMDDPDFPAKISPHQIRNPEYWSEDYVMVTSLKAFFVADAIERGIVTHQMVSWLDFGYCRDETALAGKTSWSYDFDPTKIHMWNCEPINAADANTEIVRAVTQNQVLIFGAMVVAHRGYWSQLSNAMISALQMLMANNLVDDDQGLWLICYLGNPEAFELHALDYSNPFIVFKDYND